MAVVKIPYSKGFIEAQIDDARCIRCYCCQELCPANAIRLQSGWLLKLAQRFMK